VDNSPRQIGPGTQARGGQLKFLSLLGEGGFGQVFLAETAQGLRAVKVVDTSVWSKREYEVFNAMLMAEASFLGTLQHPVLPEFSQLIAEGNRYFLVMEWVRGQNLEDYVKQQGVLGLEDFFLLLGSLIQVLHYFHRECEGGVVFGDLKPANVLRAGLGEYRLVDLGLASKKGHRMGGRFSIFSPAFSAPEFIVGALSHPAQDLYSLGATMMFALSGEEQRRGWSGRRAADLSRRWLSFRKGDWKGSRDSLQRFEELLDLVLACLEHDPGWRPASIRLLKDRWEAVARDLASEEQPSNAGRAEDIMARLYESKGTV
jgi:serine/threonine protein kinase